MPIGVPGCRHASPDPWRPGDLIARYELVEQIGAGGMGVVWSARDVALGRDVAVKLIRSPDGTSTRMTPLGLADERALREARAMARLSHPNVVTIHDVGTTHEGVFIAMERMDGGTLTEWLRSAPRPWPEVVAAFIAAGRGLAEAHRAGLVHRDFKSDNVLVGRDSVARVSDFGLALPLREAGDELRPRSDRRGCCMLDQDEVRAGTLAYMAPEQLSGDRVDARSDQFSFCVALYEGLYGIRPFGAPTGAAPSMSLLAAILDRRIARPPRSSKVPGRVRDVVVRGLASDPVDRWPSMDELVAALELRARAPLARPRMIDDGVAIVAALGIAWAALWSSAATTTNPAPDRQAGVRVLHRVLSQFRESGAAVRCEYAYPSEGDWAVTLELDPVRRRILLYAGGDLAMEPVGSCLRAELEYLTHSAPIPAGLDRAFLPDTVTLPVEPVER